jgi:HlyD family secretion protein
MTEIKNNASRLIRNTIVVAMLVAVIVVILMARSYKNSDPAVRAARATRQELVTSVTTNGKVEPIQNFEAHSPGPLTIRKVYVQAGGHVDAGQLLMQLDDADALTQVKRAQSDLFAAQAEASCVENGGCNSEQANNHAELVKAQNELVAAKQNLATVQKLHDQEAATAAEVQAAQNRVNLAQQQVELVSERKNNRYSGLDKTKATALVQQAQAQLQQAQHLLDQTNIRAPFAGTVYFVGFKQSEFANSGELLLQVADLSKLQVRAFVDEPEIGHLSVGDPVSVQWDALPGQSWPGSLTQVPSSITTYGTRNVGQALSQIENRDSRLIPNVNVTVTITTSHEKDVVTVPREAVHVEGSQRFVYAIADGKLKRFDVNVGASNLTIIEVKNGLSEGTEVALGALNSQPLHAGMAVHVAHE